MDARPFILFFSIAAVIAYYMPIYSEYDDVCGPVCFLVCLLISIYQPPAPPPLTLFDKMLTWMGFVNKKTLPINMFEPTINNEIIAVLIGLIFGGLILYVMHYKYDKREPKEIARYYLSPIKEKLRIGPGPCELDTPNVSEKRDCTDEGDGYMKLL